MILHELLIDPAVFLHKHLVSFVITLDSRIFVELDIVILNMLIPGRVPTHLVLGVNLKMSFFSEMCKE